MLRAAGDARLAERSERCRLAAFAAAVQIDSNPHRRRGARPTDPDALYRKLMGTDTRAPNRQTAEEARAQLLDRFDLPSRFPDRFPAPEGALA